MIKGIADLEYTDAKKLICEILNKAKDEDKALRRETEDRKIEILMHEYRKRLDGGSRRAECENAIEKCNERMLRIEEELFALVDRISYFEVQLEKLEAKA